MGTTRTAILKKIFINHNNLIKYIKITIMKKNIYLLLLLLFVQISTSNATTFIVNSTAWANTGAGTTGDLLWCFNQVNATAGGPHTISFAGLAGSPAVITFTSRIDLNSANANGLTIDGETKSGWTCGNPNVVFVGGWTADLTLTNRSNVTIKALSLRSFDLTISGGSFNNVYGCWFNLDNAGTGRSGNSGAYLSAMFTVSGGSTDNIIGGTTCNTRNVFNHGTSPYAWTGFVTLNNAARTSIVGNYFGTDKTGNVSLRPTIATGTPNITVTATANATIDQNVITSTDMSGIYVTGISPNLTISNNMIGVGQNGAGTTFSNVGGGILIASTSTVNSLLITGNTISNNTGTASTRGINYLGISNSITISNNKIGSNSTGLDDGSDYGNENGGIVINGGATSNLTISNNVIVRNGWVTLDNNACGIFVGSAVNTITMNNNTIGVYANYAKTNNSGNGWAGIWIYSASTNITITDNVIGNNGNGGAQKSHGIAFASGPSNIDIYGNYIGVDPSGNDIGNYANGIEINPASNVRIGGTGAGQRNYIGFNKGSNAAGSFPRAGGIALIAATNITIRNNSIGVGPTGATAGHTNFSGTSSVNYGIFTEGVSSHIYIGGINANEGNIIANSGGNGILVFAGTYVQMRKNSIYCNALKGIAITAGQNNGIVPPVINTLTTAPTAGYLNQVNGTADANYIVEIFITGACAAACNTNPQGQSLLNTVTATGGGTFNYTHGSTIFNYISATQTNSGCLASTLANDNCYTSEFSTCVTNVLPVTWMSFIAKKKGNAVELEWITGSEKDAGVFIVERSLDGKNFQDIGLVNALNNSNGGRYSYTDQDIFSGNIYYRIRQVDTDGTVDFSIVRVVNSSLEKSLIIAPNPIDEMISIKLYDGEINEVVSVQIYNALGQEVYSNESTSSLLGNTPINLSHLSTGAYAIKITTRDTKWFERIIKN